MAIYNPAISAIVQNIPDLDGFLLSPPVAWPTVAAQFAIEAGSSTDANHVHEKGELHGTATPKLQDTFLLGTAGRTGKAFTVAAGTVKDDWVSPRTSKYGLLVPDSGTAFEVVAATTDSAILPAQVVIRRGAMPVSTSPTRANFYTYLHLQYQGVTDYRIALEWGKPLRLDYFSNGAWAQVETSKQVPDLEAYFAMNSSQITLKIVPDPYDNTLTIRVGNHVALRHSPPGGLTAFGNVRLVGQNGWCTFEYYPLRFQPLTVTKSQRDFGQLKPVGAAAVVLNSRGVSPSGQTVSSAVTGNGQQVGYTATAQNPDAGDGLGSTYPPKLVDATLVIPSVWMDSGFSGGTVFLPPVMRAELLETLDDATRTVTSSALLTVNNYNGLYAGSYGHQAVQLAVATGVDPYALCFRGIGGAGPRGIELYRQDPVRLMTLPCTDNSYKMMVPLAQEVCFDGWCIFSAVRFLAESGNIHPRYLQTIPLYVPPGASQAAPYGPAGADCPYFILGRGTGLNAKYKFLPDWSPWEVLQRLVADAGDQDPITGLNIPYFMGNTPDGQFHFESYSPRRLQPVIAFQERDVTGYAQIEEIRVFNSVYQMRTSVDFQGIDAITNELLYYHLNLPDSVMKAVGFRYPWLERDARFASAAYMQQIANSAAAQASLPTQVWTVKAPYHPWLRAGMCALTIESQALGTAIGYITEIRSTVGLDDVTGRVGTQSCFSYVTMRSVANF